MNSNIFKANYENKIFKDDVEVGYTIFDVFLVNKYLNLNISKEFISNCLDFSSFTIDEIKNFYSLGLDKLVRSWLNNSSFMVDVYEPFYNLLVTNNGDLKSDDMELNISFSNVIKVVTDYFNSQKIGEICNKYLISEDLVKRVSFRYIAGDFNDIEKSWLSKKGFDVKAKNSITSSSSNKDGDDTKINKDPVFNSSEFPYKNLEVISDDGALKSTFSTLELKLPEIINIYNEYLNGSTLEELSLTYGVSEVLIDRVIFRYKEGDFNNVVKLWESNSIDFEGETEDDGPEYSNNLDNVKFISTNVKVGKSYKNHGWTLPRDDLIELIPLLDYEEECDILVDDIPVKARFDLHPRIFFDRSNDEVVDYLKKQHDNNPNIKAKLKILLNKNEYKLVPYSMVLDSDNEEYQDLISENKNLNEEVDLLKNSILQKDVQLQDLKDWEIILKYISPINNKFSIKIPVNGVLKDFGVFDSLDEAIKERDLILKNL